MAVHTAPRREERTPLRLWLTPIVSTLVASLGALLPIATPVPLLPPFGLLMLLAWRLRRPELWQAWIALPLGLVDDLVTGAPLGSAMILWTLVLLGLDIVDYRLVWRDRSTDWGLACCSIGFAEAGAWAISLATGGAGPLWTIVPPALIGILCYPLAARVCATLDRLRLRARRG